MKELVEKLEQYEQQIIRTLNQIKQETRQIINSLQMMGINSQFYNSIDYISYGNEINIFKLEFQSFILKNEEYIKQTIEYNSSEPVIEKTTSVPINNSNTRNYNQIEGYLKAYEDLTQSINSKITEYISICNEVKETYLSLAQQQQSNLIENKNDLRSDLTPYLIYQKDIELANSGDIKASLRLGIYHQKSASKLPQYAEQALDEASRYYAQALTSATTNNNERYIEISRNHLRNLGRDDNGKHLPNATSNPNDFPEPPSP